MELAWKGYVITLGIRRKKSERVADSERKQVFAPPLAEQRREEIEKEYIRASGNRCIGPTR
jgi:hypothetical protein